MPENGGYKGESNGGSTSIEMTKMSSQVHDMQRDIEKGMIQVQIGVLI